jgi:hypothetical protein
VSASTSSEKPRSSPAVGVEQLTPEQRERLYTNLLIAVLSTVVVAGGTLDISQSKLRAASGTTLSVESNGHGGLSLRLHRRRNSH